MPKVMTSTATQSQFGSLLKWTAEQDEEVIIELYGKPTAVLISYAEYEKMVRLQEQERRRTAWEAIEAVRKQVRARNQDLDQEEAYRLAGFGEDVIQETMRAEKSRPTVAESPA